MKIIACLSLIHVTHAKKRMESTIKKWVKRWLWSGIFLVIFMVVVGGITRLTGSGLSIVKWNLVTGTFPPLTEEAWNIAFEEYKQSPQFQKINHSFDLGQFKGIFWWEYFHRLAGRLIGILFIVPFTILVIRKLVPPWLMKHLIVILILGASQGVMGWLMVKSGLNDIPYVSHYRLALHLSFALVLIASILWTILKIDRDHESSTVRNPIALPLWCLAILCLQIILGAFVAGLKAGYSYNTYPLMEGSLIPPGTWLSDDLFSNGVFIQFLHRWVAWLVPISLGYLWYRNRNTSDLLLYRYFQLITLVTAVQIILGILTLIYMVPVSLGVFHQLIAVVIFLLLIMITFRMKYFITAKTFN